MFWYTNPVSVENGSITNDLRGILSEIELKIVRTLYPKFRDPRFFSKDAGNAPWKTKEI
jgi:hypothetical protein